MRKRIIAGKGHRLGALTDERKSECYGCRERYPLASAHMLAVLLFWGVLGEKFVDGFGDPVQGLLPLIRVEFLNYGARPDHFVARAINHGQFKGAVGKTLHGRALR